MSPQTQQDRPIVQTLDRCDPAPYTRGEYARRLMWMIVQRTLFRLPMPRGFRWRAALLRMFGARLGIASSVHSSTRIMHPWLLEMGDWSMIGPDATVYNLGLVTIGHHAVISQDVYLCAGTHDYKEPALPLLRPPIRIGSGVWIAAGAFIAPGAVIGDNTVIGARAMVVGEIPAGVVAAGNPCRVLKPREMNAH